MPPVDKVGATGCDLMMRRDDAHPTKPSLADCTMSAIVEAKAAQESIDVIRWTSGRPHHYVFSFAHSSFSGA